MFVFFQDIFLCYDSEVLQWKFGDQLTTMSWSRKMIFPLPDLWVRYSTIMKNWHGKRWGHWGKLLPLIIAPSYLGAFHTLCIVWKLLDFVFKNKSRFCFVLFYCFVLFPYHNLFYLVSHFWKFRPRFWPPTADIPIIPFAHESWFQRSCFRCNDLIHLQNLSFGESWATPDLQRGQVFWFLVIVVAVV